MYLTETHFINNNHAFYQEIDKLTFLSKNLYNRANYIVRQEFIKTSKQKEQGLVDHATYLNYHAIRKLLIKEIDYTSLPRKVSNQILMKLDKNWKSFFKSIKEWKTNPSKFTGKPSLPRYKHKIDGRNSLTYELGAISKKELKKGNIKLSGTNINIPFINKQYKLIESRIITLNNHEYKIENVYEKEEQRTNLIARRQKIASMDIGLNNLGALTFSSKNSRPVLVSGRTIKSINQYFNKEKSRLLSELMKMDDNLRTSKKIDKLTRDRNHKILHCLHEDSTAIVRLLVTECITDFVIGYNPGWKNKINLGDITNQNFVSVPFLKFINMLKYKCELKGINVHIVGEAHTSKCSFLDLEEIGHQEKYVGKRTKRGMFISKDNIKINADVNSSYNIMRKVFPEVFSYGIEGFAVNPWRLNVGKFLHSTSTKSKNKNKILV